MSNGVVHLDSSHPYLQLDGKSFTIFLYQWRIELKKGILLLICAVILTGNISAQEEKSLHYDVKVSMQVIPVFALDKQGNPCFDLKQEELKLLVNGKETPIALFNRYVFTDSEVEKTRQKVRTQLPPQRYVFIIIDSIFNSVAGLRRSKEIAAGLVDKMPGSDSIILMENNNGGGLKLVGGPTKNKTVLKRWIEDIRQIPENRMKMSKRDQQALRLDASQGYHSRQNSFSYALHAHKDREAEEMRTKTDMKYFSHVLSRFKYTLAGITRPKIVFLISEGISRGAMKEEWYMEHSDGTVTSTLINNQEFYFEYLKKIARAINEGGSVMVAVNPRQVTPGDDEETSGKESLKYLAGESGGRYFAGLDTQKMVERIKQTTAAYYELFFTVDAAAGRELSIVLKSKRKGVRVNTVRHNEKELPYSDMPRMQQQLFVLDILNGGMWSRMASQVGKPVYREVDSKKQNGKTVKTIEILLPKQMRNRKLDIYTLQMDAATRYADITTESRVVGDNARIELEILWDRIPYFAIVEPQATFCIYNKVAKD